MRRSTTVLRIVATVALAAGAALPAAAEWLLRLRLDEGDTHRFALTHSQSMNLDLNGMAQQVENSMRMEIRQAVQRKLDDGSLVLETVYERMRTEMGTGGMTLTFDTAKPEPSAHPMGLLQQQMIGKPFVVTASPRGQVLEVAGIDALLEAMEQALPVQAREGFGLAKQSLGEAAMKSMLQHSVLTYPERALGAGDTWEQQIVLPNPALGELRVSSEYHVVGQESLRRRDCVKVAVISTIEVSGDGTMFDQLGQLFGSEVHADVSHAKGDGTIWVDSKTGLVVESRVSQAMELAMSFEMPAQEGADPQQMNLRGTVTQETKVELLD